MSGVLYVLVFRHPLAGCQLVKGTIDRDESPGEAALRELLEEAGVTARLGASLGTWQLDPLSPAWSFHLCEPAVPLATTWIHHCQDDGGHDFEVSWWPLAREPSAAWHPVHAEAVRYLRDALGYHVCAGHVPLQPAKAEQSQPLGSMRSVASPLARRWERRSLAVDVLERMTHLEVELCVSRLH